MWVQENSVQFTKDVNGYFRSAASADLLKYGNDDRPMLPNINKSNLIPDDFQGAIHASYLPIANEKQIGPSHVLAKVNTVLTMSLIVASLYGFAVSKTSTNMAMAIRNSFDQYTLQTITKPFVHVAKQASSMTASVMNVGHNSVEEMGYIFGK